MTTIKFCSLNTKALIKTKYYKHLLYGKYAWLLIIHHISEILFYSSNLPWFKCKLNLTISNLRLFHTNFLTTQK